jgi:hypothetical protein
MVTNEQLKPTTIPGSFNPQQTLTDVYVPSTFEDRFGALLNNPMPSNLGLRIPIDDFKTEYADGSKFRGLFQKSGDKLKQDPNFDPITSRVITTPLSEVEPYLKYDSNYDNNLNAAFGQAGKGAVVGGGVGSFFSPIGTAIGAGVGGTLGFFSGLLTTSGRGVYIPGRDNRQEILEKQSGFWNTLGGFTNNFLDRSFEAGIGGTAALLTSPFGAIAGREFYDWGSNPLTRKLSESLEQSEYKRHLSDNYLNKGPIAKFFTAEGFQNEIADMAGFTVGMMLGAKINMGLNAGAGQAVSKLAIGLKNPGLATSISNRGGNLIGDFLPTVAKRASALFTKGSTKLTAAQQAATFSELNLVTLAKNAFKKGTFEDYGKNLINAFKNPAFGLKALSSFERTALASYGEGRVEAAQAYKDIYDTALKNGYSASESAEMATKGANKTLLGNLAILGVTNQFGLNQLTNVSSIKNLSRWFSKDFTLDVTTSKILKETLKDISKNATKGFVIEGFGEELGQFAISQAAKNQQLNMADPLNPIHKAFFTEFIEAYKDGISSDEGMSNWFGGGLFGSVMGGFGPGGIMSTLNEANKAKTINIPDSLKTKISNFSSAIDFISKHTVPFNGQLFQSYREENGEYIPDNNGTVRLINDPTRLIKLTQALNHINTLSKDQANLILTNVKNNIKTEDPAMQEGFKIIKDYVDLFGETGEKSLEEYINQDLSSKEKQNTLYLLSKLGETVIENEYALESDLSNIAKSMVSSSYVFDHVVNGIEDKIFDELDALEESLLDPTSESGQKDLIEFFGKNYKLDQLDQAKEDIKTFRDQLKKQVKIFKGLANRYSEPFTHINIKKDNKVHKLPITVDMYSVFRSALVQDDLNTMVSEIDEKLNDIKSELLADPQYSQDYLNPNNTSEDVLDIAKKENNNPLYLQYQVLENLKKQVSDSLQKENKAFEELTDVKKLIEKAQKSEKAINSEIENPAKSEDLPKPKPVTVTESSQEPEDNPEEKVEPVVSTDAKADIERIRQENDSLGKSILQKLGYKNENRLPNGNVKGGQSGWKIRFNIKSPTGGNYFNTGNKTLENDKHYNEQAQKLVDWLNSYFGTKSKGSVSEAIKGYTLFGFTDEHPSSIWKFLSGGEQGESDFTIYIGSADDVLKFVEDVKKSPIADLLVAGNQGSDVNITPDGIFKARIEGSKIGFSGYGAPIDLNVVTGEENFTFVFDGRRVNINYGKTKGPSDISITVEGGNSEGINWNYKVVGDDNLKKDFPELYKNIRNIIGFQLYGDYLQGSNNEFLKLTGVDKINAKYDAELKELEQKPISTTQSEIASKTQDEFAQYLQDNHSDRLSQEQIYKLLTVRPELREKMLNDSPEEWAKIFEKNQDYRQQANNVDNNKEMRGNANPAWTGISIGETANQEQDGRHKGYVTLDVNSAREMGKNLEQTFKDLYQLLKDAGYNGHLKMPGVYSDLLTRFDNIVIHGATKGDVSLALPIIEQYFKDKGLNVEGTKTGIDAKDSNGKETSHTNLLAEKVKNKSLEKPISTTQSDIESKTKEELFPIDSLHKGKESGDILKVIGYIKDGVRFEIQTKGTLKPKKNLIISELKRLIIEGKLAALEQPTNGDPASGGKSAQRPPIQGPVEYGDPDNDNSSLEEEDYRADASRTPLSQTTIFKTYGADFRNGKIQLNNIAKSYFYDQILDLKKDHFFLPIPVSSELALSIVKDKEGDFYKDYKANPTDLIYLLVGIDNDNNPIVYNLPTGKTIPEQIPLIDILSNKTIPTGLIYDKSSTFPIDRITEKFSRTEKYSTQDIDKIYNNYILGLNQMAIDSLSLVEEYNKDVINVNKLRIAVQNNLKPIIGITPGVQDGRVSKVKYEKLSEDYSIHIPTLETAIETKYHELKLGTVYAYQNGKYTKTLRRKFNKNEAQVLANLIKKSLSGEILETSEELYLKSVLNWFDNLTTPTAYNKNSVGIVNGQFIAAPYFGNNNNPKLGFTWSIDDSMDRLVEFFSSHYPHINKTKLNTAYQYFQDKETDTIYENYEEYLIEREIITIPTPVNDRLPVKSNRQLIFDPQFGFDNIQTNDEKNIYRTSKIKLIKDNFTDPMSIQHFFTNDLKKTTPSEEKNGNKIYYFNNIYLSIVGPNDILLAGNVSKYFDNDIWNNTSINAAQVTKDEFDQDVIPYGIKFNLMVTIDSNDEVTINIEKLKKNESTEESEDPGTDEVKNERESPEETPEAQKETSENEEDESYEDSDEGIDEEPPFRLFTDSTDIENIEEFKVWLSEILPQFSVQVSSDAIKGVAQGALIGSFITLWKNAGSGTGYHEAFEAVWGYFIDSDTKEKLIKEFKSKEGTYKNPFNKKTVKYSESTDNDVKEMLAEGFIDFMKNRKLQPKAPIQNNFFLKLLDLLKRLFSNISKIFKKSEKEAIDNINDIYEKIASGNYSQEVISDFNLGIQFRQRFAAEDIDLNHVHLFNSMLYDRVMSLLGFSNIYDIIDNNIENDVTTSELIGKHIIEQGNALLTELQSEFKTKKIKGFSFFDDNFEFKNDSLRKELLENATQVFLQKSKLDSFVSIDSLDEMEVSSKEGIVPTNEINPTSNVNNVTRFLLNNLKYYTANEAGVLQPAVVNTYFGKTRDITLTINKKPDFTTIQTFLLNKLANVVPYYKDGQEVALFDAMMEKLSLYENKETWIKDLKYKLGIGYSSLSDNIIKMRLAFVTSFKNAEYEPIVLRSSDNVVYMENPVYESSQTALLESWISNVQDKASLSSSVNITLNKDLNKGQVIFPKKGLTNKYEQRDYFKDILGIDIGDPKEDEIIQALDTILSIIKFRQVVIFDDLVKDYAQSSFRTLSKYIASKESSSSKSYKNSDGKAEFSIINPTFISDIINVYNSVDNYNDFLLSYPHFHNNFELKLGLKNNYFLKKGGFLFDKNGLKYKNSKITLKLLSGIQDKTNVKGFSFSKMSLEDKLVFKAVAALSGNYSLLMNSDKNMENSLSFNDKYLLKSLDLNPSFFSKDYNSSSSLNTEAVKIIENYFLPQLKDEIDLLFSKDALNVQFLKDKIKNKELGYYQDIVNFSKEDFEKIANDYNSTQSGLYSYLQSAIPSIYVYLRNQIENDYQNLYKAGFFKNIDGRVLISRQILNSKEIEFMNQGLNAYLDFKGIKGKEREKYIQRITGKNQNTSIASGRLASFFFKKIDEIYMIYAQAGYKDITASNLEHIFRKIAIQVTVNYEIYNKDIQGFLYGPFSAYKKGDFGKRAGFLASSKQSQDNSITINNHLNLTSKRLDGKNRDGLLSFVSYKDPIVVSARITSIAEDFYKVLKNDKHSHDTIERLVGAKFKKDGTLKEITAEPGTLLAPYEELKLADAQAYIMLDTFYDLLYKSGKLTRSQKVHIQYEMALERIERSELPKTDPAYRPLTTKQKVKDLEFINNPQIKKEANSAVLQVLKPQGSGFNQNNLDVAIPIFLKNSVVPLSWSRVKNNPILRDKYITWQKNQIDLIGFESGQKIGAILKDGNSTPLYNIDGFNAEIPFIQKMKFNDFGIQQETPNEFKNSVNRGVQITKLIVGNLSHHFKNKPHIKELVDEYYANLNELYQRGYDSLMKKLGLKLEGNYYVTDNLSNLVETLSEQAKLLKLPINVKDMFVVDSSTGKLPYKFDASTERHRIEYILNSILDRTLIHQKVKGTQAPQISSVFEQSNLKPLFKRKGIWTEYTQGMKLSADEEKSIRYSSTDLKILEDGTIEVKIPSYLKGLVNLNTSKIDPELLELIGYRIPTQSFGQVEKIKIVGFLDQSYGDAIIVPAELVGKSGSDFDIDKLNLYFPHYYKDKQGNYRYISYSTSDEELGLRYNNYIKSNEEKVYRKLKQWIFDAIKDMASDLNINLNKEDLSKFFTKKTFRQLPNIIKEEYFDLQETLQNSESKILEKTIAHIQKTSELISEYEEALANKEEIEYEDKDGNIVISPFDVLPLLYTLQTEYDTLLNAAGYNQDQIELIREKLKEFNEYKTELLTKDLPNIPNEIAITYGYMSIDDFSKLPILKQNSLEALENRNIELMKRLISLPENRLQHLAPNSASTIEAMDKIINSSEVKKKSYHLSTFYGSTEFRNIMVSAKNLVGAGALHITGHQITQMFNVSFSDEDTFKHIPFIKSNRLDKVYDSKGRLISSNLSEFLSAFVDAAKDPFAVRLNLNNSTINVALMLIRLGVSIEEVLYFINQPSIKRYVARYNNVSSLLRKSSNESQNRAMAEAYVLWESNRGMYGKDSLKHLRIPFNAEKINTQDELDLYSAEEKKTEYISLTDKTIETIFNYGTFEEINRISYMIKKSVALPNISTSEGSENYLKNLEKSLTGNISNEIKHETDIYSLGLFMSLLKPAQELSTLNTATNIESKKTKTLIENRSLLNTVSSLLGRLSPPFTNLDAIFSQSHLSTVYNNRKDFDKYLAPYLMVADPTFSNLLDSIATQGYISLAYGQAKNDLVYKFNTFLLSYLVQNNPNFRPTQDHETMFKRLASRIKAIQTSEHYKPFKSHNLFKNISYTLRGQFGGDLKTQIRLLKYQEEETIDRDIEIQKHENAYELALSRMKSSRLPAKKEFYEELVSIYEDLVDYSILQSGLSAQFTSLAGILPADLFAKKVSKYLDLTNLNVDLSNLWDIFVRNNHRNPLLVDIKPEVIRNSNIIDYNGNTYYRVYSRVPYIKRNISNLIESEDIFSFEETEKLESKFLRVLPNEEIKGIVEELDLPKSTNWKLYEEITALGDQQWYLETKDIYDSLSSRIPGYIEEDYSLPEETIESEKIQLSQTQIDTYVFYKELYTNDADIRELFYIFADNYDISYNDINSLLKTLILDHNDVLQPIIEKTLIEKAC